MKLASLETTEGHLRDVPVDFVAGLNCIIGARGTCKSTIVETIRFLFNDDPDRVQELLGEGGDGNEASHRGLIRATLGGGTAKLQIDLDTPEGGLATIERDTSSKPRIYVDEVKVIDDPALLRAIEIYSQGELQEIATSPAKRLALIDRPNMGNIEEWRNSAKSLAKEIASIGPELRELRDAIEATEAAIREGRPLQHRLAEMRAKKRPSMTPELSELRARFEQGRQLLKAAEDVLNNYREASTLFQEAIDTMDAVASEADGLRQSAISGVDEIASAISDAAKSSRRGNDALPEFSRLEELLGTARDSFEADSRDYYEAMQQQEAMTATLRQEDRLAEEVQRLERLEAELLKHQEGLAGRERQRTQLRQRLAGVRTKIFQSRLTEVERINSEFSDDIVLVLKRATQADNYREQLSQLLEGSRIRERATLCRQLAAVFPPQVLVTLVEEERADDLANSLDRDLGQMTRLVAHLAGSEKLYQLENEAQDDELEITMYKQGTSRSVSEMSKGEMATAILPLLLRRADYPLVLDQPEDDLDNRFIFRTLAAKIKELKHHRQLIFVTHNANIPVIGEADKVFAMEMDTPTRASLLGSGDVEEMKGDIIEILEGGEEAFKRRSESYGF